MAATKTDFFELIADDSNPNAAICTEYDLRGVGEYDLNQCIMFNQWPEEITFSYDGGELEDLLGEILGWPLVSERMRLIILEHAGENVQFLPVTIVDRSTGVTMKDEYKALNILECRPAMHREASTYIEHPETPQFAFTILKLVIAREKAGDAQLFRLGEKRVEIIAGSRLKQALEALHVTGCQFLPLKAV